MPHGRKLIRDAVVSALTAGVTTATVYSERRRRLDAASDLPAVIVSMGEDAAQADQRAMGEPAFTVERQQTVIVEIHARGDEGLPAAELIDQIELEAEGALAADLTLGGVIDEIAPSTSVLEANADQEQVLSLRTVEYIATWRHRFGEPDTPEG